MNPVPNTNGTTDTGRWDYGPFQLNAYWIGRAIDIGQVSAEGINVGSALGGHGVKAGEPFAGDPYENGRLAARYLNSLGTIGLKRRQIISPVAMVALMLLILAPQISFFSLLGYWRKLVVLRPTGTDKTGN